MGKKPSFDQPTAASKHKYKDIEIKDYFSGFIDFEVCGMVLKRAKVLFAALMGTVVEWYDYALYGYMAAALSQRFFPGSDPTVALIKHFLVFAIGFAANPLGTYIFGSIGDKWGRKYALRWNILGIAIPTVLIGCLPVYQDIGIASVWLLCLCRLAQGLFIAAENDGVDIFVYETLPKTHACLANTLTWCSSLLGLALAMLVAGWCTAPELPDWMWRVPFWGGGVLGLVTLWFRKNLVESYDYVRYLAVKPPVSSPTSYLEYYWEGIKNNKIKLLLTFLLIGGGGGTNCFYFVFWKDYLHEMLHIPPNIGITSQPWFGLAFSILIAPICGYFADRIGLKRALQAGGIACLFMTILNGIWLYTTRTNPTLLMLLTVTSLTLFHISIYVAASKLFNVGERYRCRGISRAFGAAIFSSLTPTVATFIWHRSHYLLAPLAFCCFLLVMGLVAATFVSFPIEEAETEEAEIEEEDD